MRRTTLTGILLAVSAAVLAQSSGGPYTMRKEVIAGGGGGATGGGYTATVTQGQPAAAVQSGGIYRLTGGFHGPRGVDPNHVFCDSFEDSPCQ